MKKLKKSILASLTIALSLTAAQAQTGFIDVNLSGTTEYEGWSDLNNTNNPGYPGFPGTAPWPSPIAPNEAGSAGNAGFDKVSGGGYPGTTSIYNFTSEGTFAVSSSSPLAGLETLVFQVQLGIGDAFFTSDPVLNYNGGTQALTADFMDTNLGDITYTNPQSGSLVSTTNFQFQWDVSSAFTITDFEIVWTSAPHVTTHALQLDSSDTFSQVVPEPSTYALIFGGITLALALYRRRRR